MREQLKTIIIDFTLDKVKVNSYTIALDAVLVKCKSLIASAGITAQCIFATAVFAHPRKFHALVDVLALGKTATLWTQFLVQLGSSFWTCLALFAAPSATNGTATEDL